MHGKRQTRVFRRFADDSGGAGPVEVTRFDRSAEELSESQSCQGMTKITRQVLAPAGGLFMLSGESGNATRVCQHLWAARSTRVPVPRQCSESILL